LRCATLSGVSLPLLMLGLIVFGLPSFFAGRFLGASAWACLLAPPVVLVTIALAVSDDADWLVGGTLICMLFAAMGVLTGRDTVSRTA